MVLSQGQANSDGTLHKDILEVEVGQLKGGINKGELFWRCHTGTITASLFNIRLLISAGYLSMDDVRYGRWGDVGRKFKLDTPIPAKFLLKRNHRIGKNFWEVLSIREDDNMPDLTSDQKNQVYEFVKTELSRLEMIECIQEDDRIAFKLKTKATNIFNAQDSIHTPMQLFGCEICEVGDEHYLTGICKYPLNWSTEALHSYGYPTRMNGDELEVGYSQISVGDVVKLNIPYIYVWQGKITRGETGVVIECKDDATYKVQWGKRSIETSAARHELIHLPNEAPPKTITHLIEADKHRQPDEDTEEYPAPYDDSDARWEHKVEEEECESLASPDGLLQIDRDDYVASLEQDDSTPPPNSEYLTELDELRREKAAATRRADVIEMERDKLKRERDKLKEAATARESSITALHNENAKLQASVAQLKSQVEQLTSLIPAEAAPLPEEKVVKYGWEITADEFTRIYNAGYEIIEQGIARKGDTFVFNVVYARPRSITDTPNQATTFKQIIREQKPPIAVRQVEPTEIIHHDPILNQAKTPFELAWEAVERGEITLEAALNIGNMQAIQSGLEAVKS